MSKSTPRVGLVVSAGIVGLFGLMGVARANATFNLTPTANMNAQALAGFQSAAAYWSSVITDNITINLNVDYRSLSDNILGQTNVNRISYGYDSVRTALTSHATSANDLTAVAHLPAGTSLSFRTNNLVTGASYIDNNGTTNNTWVQMSYAGAKALGFLAANANTTEASIAFTDRYAWDFDRSNGIDANATDFVGVAIHEIGHALGFNSGVDIVDQYSNPNGVSRGQRSSMDDYFQVSSLDLYRYDAPGQLNQATGGSPYFSIDGGVTNLALFSTGAYNGDSHQASHWKDDLGLGVMDPTAAPGEFMTVTPLDLEALDVIGFNIASVPEPATASLLALAAGGVLLRRPNRKQARI